MLPPNYFYWFRIDNNHMTEPWLDQALMGSAYRSGEPGEKDECTQDLKSSNVELILCLYNKGLRTCTTRQPSDWCIFIMTIRELRRKPAPSPLLYLRMPHQIHQHHQVMYFRWCLVLPNCNSFSYSSTTAQDVLDGALYSWAGSIKWATGDIEQVMYLGHTSPTKLRRTPASFPLIIHEYASTDSSLSSIDLSPVVSGTNCFCTSSSKLPIRIQRRTRIPRIPDADPSWYWRLCSWQTALHISGAANCSRTSRLKYLQGYRRELDIQDS